MGYRKVKVLEQVYYVFRWRLLRWLDRLGGKRR